MILFERDFEYEGATLHTKTTNTSFIKMHALLKAMGIKNNKFFLAIKQPELMEIDPHNVTDPSKELAARIAYEIKINPWYYYREVVRIPAAGTMPIPFRLHRANLALIWTFYNNIDIFLTIPRQTGKTMSTQAIVSHLMYFMCYSFSMAMLTKDNALIQENVTRLKEIRNGLPQYLLDCNKILDTERKEGLSYAKLKNQYLTFVAQNDQHGAEKLGRGMSTPMQHWDEFAFFKNIAISYPKAISATNAAAEQAAAAGLPHTNILTTTAGKLDSPEGRFAKDIIDRCMLFTEHLYDSKGPEELHSLIKSNSLNNMIYMVFSYLQLGKTHEWFKEKSIRSGGTKDDIDRDYLNIWTSGAQGNVIAEHLLNRVRNSMAEPEHIDIKDGYMFRWYIHPDVALKSKLYRRTILIGLDTSENVGRDFTSLCFTDAADLSVLCTARCNDADLVKLADFIADLLINHDNVFLIPERKSTATVILALICTKLRKKGIDPYTRIYNQVFQYREDPKFSSINTSSTKIEEGTAKKYLGFTTSGGEGGNSRDVLFKTTLIKTLEMNATRIHDSTLIDEICGLIVKNGRIDHASGKNDDLLVAYLLTCWFVYFGKNLYLYKLRKEDFLSSVNSSGEAINPDVRQAQIDIANRINEVKKQIEMAKYPVIKSSLMRELTNLESLVDPEVMNIDPIRSEDISNMSGSVKFNPATIRKYLSILSD